MSTILRPSDLFTVVPTIVPAAYAAGDQIGTQGKHQLLDVVEGPKTIALLESLILFDGAKQKSAIDILFWNSNPTVASTDNAPFDVTDAQCIEKLIGYVSIAAANYADLANSAVATVKDIRLPLQPLQNTDNSFGRSLWLSFVCRGTPTYAAATDLKLWLALQ